MDSPAFWASTWRSSGFSSPSKQAVRYASKPSMVSSIPSACWVLVQAPWIMAPQMALFEAR